MSRVDDDFVGSQIEKLRRRLLDLSARNPLVSTRFSPRSNAHIRLVDELPDVLMSRLHQQVAMRLRPLPELDEDPKDEAGSAFQDALTEARSTDEAYLEAVESIDPDADDALDREREAERELRDRIRVLLGMPPRAGKGAESLAQHARNNGIDPSYDLPLPAEGAEANRHVDDDLQTLLLPKEQERKAKGLMRKCQEWAQETGVNVLHVACGFLEWNEGVGGREMFSPLVLLPAAMEVRKTRQGPEFLVSGEGDDAETNVVLVEKLRLEQGVELPIYEGGSLENYFDQVAACAPQGRKWRVRRQAAVGAWPSASLSMYRDLDPARGFAANAVVTALIGGAEGGEPAPFGVEYDVDAPEIENTVPAVVLDADSSQFSALVDIMQGRNLAIEGPPGSGKSQTIVNAIANALHAGRKVLFVAEKTAAMDVVRARLEALGLGEFLLPLLPGRTSKEAILNSIRRRFDMPTPDAPTKLREVRRRRDLRRERIAAYLALTTATFADAEQTVGELLTRAAATGERLTGLPPKFRRPQVAEPRALSPGRLDDILRDAAAAAEALAQAEAAGPAWSGAQATSLGRLMAEELTEQAGDAMRRAQTAAAARHALSTFGLAVDLAAAEMTAIEAVLRGSVAEASDGRDRAVRMFGAGPEAVAAGLDASAEFQAVLEFCTTIMDRPTSIDWPDRLEAISRHAKAAGLKTCDGALERAALAEARAALSARDALARKIVVLTSEVPEAAHWKLRALRTARGLLEQAGSAVALVTPALGQSAAVQALRRAVQEGKGLAEQRASLSREIAVDQVVSLAEVQALRVDAAIGGIFAFLSGKRRSARRRFRALAGGAAYEPARADALLARLSDHFAAERAYLADPSHAALFGYGFRGFRTDFAAFATLTGFLEAVDAQITGPEHAALRALLKSGVSDRIQLVPAEIDDEGWDQLTCSEFLGLTSATRAELERREIAIEALPDMVAGLRSSAPRDIVALERLAIEMRRAFALAESIRSASWVQALEPVFDPATSDLHAHRAACALAQRIATMGERAGTTAAIIDAGRHDAAAGSLTTAVAAEDALLTALAEIEAEAKMDLRPLAQAPDHSLLSERLGAMAADVPGLLRRSEYNAARAALSLRNVAWVLDDLKEIDGDLGRCRDVMEAVLRRALAVEVQAKHGGALAGFTGRSLDKLRAEFAELDREMVVLSRDLARAELHTRARPPEGVGTGPTSRLTDMGLLRRVAAQQRPRVSPRDLIARAGAALKELKPCWLMSPQAVANYLPRGDELFDLIIVDEASQMTPENALGALARAGQAVIVGDVNQLPPTTFFRRMVDVGDEDDGSDGVEESVLELANATFRPRRRLRWHYRSRHAELIRFCNEEIYNRDLVLFPSATEGTGRRPVVFVPVDGLYRKGSNPLEAQAMVRAAIVHMRDRPELSLGLVVVNQAQREILEEELDHAIAAEPLAQRFLDIWSDRNDGLEALFVKNIENVQGDERDVIFVGSVYGPERPGGPVAQRFGPLAGAAGRRRLNVLLSRAKHEIVTFSSMRPTDIVLDGNPGRAMLRAWLEFAATGNRGAQVEGGAAESPFEADVARRIRDLGVEAVPQIGAAGYFVDIGVRHPDWPHGWLLGVECDGASYHSSRSARDRDRLRQQILEDRGWELHRIWSTDWFDDAEAEMDRLRRRVEQRLAAVRSHPRRSLVVPTLESAPLAMMDATAPVACGAEDKVELTKDEGHTPVGARDAEVGDRVRIRYLDGNAAVLEVMIAADRHDPDAGVVSAGSPLGQSVLGAAEGDEIEVLIGAYLRRAVVETVSPERVNDFETGGF